MSNKWYVVLEVWPELMYPSVQWGRAYIREQQSFFSNNITDIMKWKTATWFTHGYIQNDRICFFYISVRILKTTSIKLFSGPHIKMTARNLHHAANTYTSTAWKRKLNMPTKPIILPIINISNLIFRGFLAHVYFCTDFKSADFHPYTGLKCHTVA